MFNLGNINIEKFNYCINRDSNENMLMMVSLNLFIGKVVCTSLYREVLTHWFVVSFLSFV